MAVSEVFKQTEIGEIPRDWDVLTLANVGEWKGGATPSMQESLFWKNGTIPWISSGDVKSVYLYDAPMKITDEAVKKSSTTLMPAKSIVTVTRSGILRKYFPVAMTMVRMAINQDIKALKVNTKNSPSFILYLLLWSSPRILATCMKSGTTVESVEFGWLKSFPVPLPPTKAEQEAIAEALSDADGLIESLEQLIAKKRQIKQGAMQELLTGKRRLPGFGENVQTKASFLGELPEDWRTPTLDTICSFENGDRGINYPSKSDFKMFGIPFVNAGHLKGKAISQAGMDYITTEKYEQLGGGKFKSGDVLFCLRGSLGKFALVKEETAIGAIASSLIIIRPQKGLLDIDFLGFYLESTHCKNMIDLLAGGAAQPNLGGQDLGKFYIALPPTLDEQIAIANILADLDNEVTELEAKLTKARKIKQGMMQELLTGRIRLI